MVDSSFGKKEFRALLFTQNRGEQDHGLSVSWQEVFLSKINVTHYMIYLRK